MRPGKLSMAVTLVAAVGLALAAVWMILESAASPHHRSAVRIIERPSRGTRPATVRVRELYPGARPPTTSASAPVADLPALSSSDEKKPPRVRKPRKAKRQRSERREDEERREEREEADEADEADDDDDAGMTEERSDTREPRPPRPEDAGSPSPAGEPRPENRGDPPPAPLPPLPGGDGKDTGPRDPPAETAPRDRNTGTPASDPR